MSVDFVARALARQQQSSGQGQSFTTLATGIPGVQVPASVKILQTTGYSADGIGSGTYVSDSLATAALATAHPLFCKADAGGRYWRLLPDDNGLIPVACGGANGFNETKTLTESLHDSTSTLALFSVYPWSTNSLLISSAGIAGPNGTGTATLLTETGGNYALLGKTASGIKVVRARVRAGTASRIYLYSNSNATAPGALYGCWFDLAAGTVTRDDFGTGKITSLGSGWFQLEITASCFNGIGIGLSDGEDPTIVTAGHTAILFDYQLYDTTSTAVIDGADNDRPAIQAAIAYGEAIDAAGTRFDAAHYAVWRVAHAAAGGKNGLFQIRKSHRFVSSCGGTTLWRRDTDGSAMGKAKFDTIGTNNYWRGGGIFVYGQQTPPDDPSASSITLHDIILDGGITDSSENTSSYGPSMQANGDGWDITDKGIWQQNNTYCGHVVLSGRSGIRYFMGELVYGSGADVSVADRKFVIGPEVFLGHTCGSCLNPNGQTLAVERCTFANGYVGIEGWTGHVGGYIRARIENCGNSSLQGGVPNFFGGWDTIKTRPDLNVVPIGELDLVLRNCSFLDVGCWLSGRVLAIDTEVRLGDPAAWAECQEVTLDITRVSDRKSGYGVMILGPGTGQTTDRIYVKVSARRTAYAIANNFSIGTAVFCYGSFGPHVNVDLGAFDVNVVPLEQSPLPDYPPCIRNWSYNITAAGGHPYDIKANDGAALDVKIRGQIVSVLASDAASYRMNLPTATVPTGYCLFVDNISTNYGPGAVCRIPSSNFYGGDDLLIPPGFGWAELMFDGNKWVVASQPPALTASASWDPPSVATGTSATTTVSVPGTVAGDKVQPRFSNDLQGLVLSAYVSAANTVTTVLFNPTGGAVNLTSGTLRVTVG